MITLSVIATADLTSKNTVKLVQSLTPIHSDIYLNFKDRKVNMKSILGILSANIKEGDILEVDVFNDSELKAVADILEKFFEKE